MAAHNSSRRHGKKPSLRMGRPPLSKSSATSISAKAARNAIRSHHNLKKSLARVLANGDDQEAEKLRQEMAAKGGLEQYQAASSLGQSAERGGDTSKVLVEWLQTTVTDSSERKLTLNLLEIGALSTRNACSKVPVINVRRIDLRSQMPGIEEIDFMNLAVPQRMDDRYDIISLSLVLNYVPDAVGRGEMLKRIPSFLRPTSHSGNGLLPVLFLVLPVQCVANSRYLTESRLASILESLGFKLLNSKRTSKLYYAMWQFTGLPQEPQSTFKKEECHAGSKRNNFAIILK